MSDKYVYEKSSGNVFPDMGLPNAAERLAKARLAAKIIEISEIRNLTQKKIADILAIDQPKISALYHGRLSGFSIARLIKFLNMLEQDVDIVIKEKTHHRKHVGGCLRVISKPLHAA